MSDDREPRSRERYVADVVAGMVRGPWISHCPHAEAVGARWGDVADEERRAELDALCDAWEAGTGRGDRRGPFDGVRLSGADVFHLAVRSVTASSSAKYAKAAALLRVLDPAWGIFTIPDLHLEGAHLHRAHLEDANLGEAHLEGAALVTAHLERACLDEAHLEGADLSSAHLEGSRLRDTYLDGADLGHAHLEGASLVDAHLVGADLGGAHLEGAKLGDAHLEGADLRGAFLDTGTVLDRVTVRAAGRRAVLVADTRWGGVNLAKVEALVAGPLGDDEMASGWRAKGPVRGPGKPEPTRAARRSWRAWQRADGIRVYQDAVRANRQLAVALQGQGMREEAARFDYRAQRLQREVLLRRGRYLSWAGSAVLDGLAGYGYKPARALLVYLALVVGFAATYYLLSPGAHLPLSPLEALVFSVTSFHGRGFSPGENVSLANPLTVLAAGEAVLGLLVEITFIATFTQRFFGSK